VAQIETPGVANVLHFNNTAAASPPRPVLDAVVSHLAREAAIGGVEAAAEAEGRIADGYDAIARLRNEIAFVESATRGWDMAFYAVPFRAGDRVITARAEYLSNYLAFLQMKARAGIEIDVVENDASGQLDLAALERAIGPRTKLIASTHVPTQGGLVNPAADVGHIAARHGILYLLDACQSIGQLAVDVRQLGCHMLSAPGRKISARAPRHRLSVCAARHDREARTALHRSRCRLLGRRPTPTSSATTRAGSKTGSASSPARSVWASPPVTRCGWASTRSKHEALGALLRRELAKRPGVSVHDLGVEQCGIVTFLKDGEALRQTRDRLSAININVRVSRSPRAPALDLAARAGRARPRQRALLQRRDRGGTLRSRSGGLDPPLAAKV
jgi:cysteine desulfurase/selenocysteine lyase